ncbi:hypothetical protein HNR40_008802 [Nonomuraea endophytica]|uniref:Uncharacterized protein n=1 Tax=Nonomuraea endophytica TaxID=714136 RepID=A0A7W8ACS4_9ACTN|nr:hypothetical protein [Nonomuraea endophytica]
MRSQKPRPETLGLLVLIAVAAVITLLVEVLP